MSLYSGTQADGILAWARRLGYRALLLCLGAALAGLVWFSHRLAGIRIYQVDECQNVYSAWLMASGQSKAFFLNLSLVHFPLAWVSHTATRATEFFVCARFFALEVFWLNVLLLAVATGVRLFSASGLVALAGAATLAPLWDYGIEVRHDNLVLAMLLLTWIVVRVHPAGKQSYFIAGALAVALEFVAFKAVVYALPLSVLLLVFPPPGHRASRGKLVLSWAAGAIGTFVLLRFLYGLAGLWQVYVAGLSRIGEASVGGSRFAPWGTLGRLLSQTPLLLALAAAAWAALAWDLCRRGRAGITWQSNLPEGLLCLGALVALLINPAPYPYNLIHLVPYAFLLAFRYASSLWQNASSREALAPILLSVVAFTHVVPFALATRRNLNWTNFHQESRMALAEALTDPSKDEVYDGIGMVPTRRSIHHDWFLHSLNINALTRGKGPRVCEMLASNPASVFIASYRTDWLNEEDHAFIRQHYVCVSDDFWVLGSELPPGGGTFEVLHAGRYRITSVKGSDLAGTYPGGIAGLMAPDQDGSFAGTLDGAPLTNHPIELSVGSHRIEAPADCQAAVVWVGPKLERIGRLGESDHRFLFVNWY